MFRDWGYDGLKLDGQHMNAVPPCYNPAHHHARPEESVEALPKFFKMIYDTSRDDAASGVVVEPAGTIAVVGVTYSEDFPVTPGALDTLCGTDGHCNAVGDFSQIYFSDAFLARFDQSGARIYGTYIGGSGSDNAAGVALDSAGNLYLTGGTLSPDFPRASPLQAFYGGGNGDVFVMKLNPAGTGILYSTYLGGSGSDSPVGLAINAAGNVFIAGMTTSPDFPIASSVRPAAPDSNAFAAKLSSSGNALLYSTFLGSDLDQIRGLALDGAGNALIAGWSLLPNAEVKLRHVVAAGLSIAAAATPDPVLTSSNLVYQIDVVNHSPASYTNVTLTPILPPSVNFVSATASPAGGSCGATVCALGTISAQAAVRVTITVQPNQAGAITALMSVAGAEFDPDLSDNSVSITVTANLNPAAPSLSIDDVSIAEGNAGMTDAVFTVSLSAPSASAVSVDYTTVDGSATAGSDYVAASGTITFNSGETSKKLPVQVIGDTDSEPDETFLVKLSNPMNATLSRAQGTGTIRNDDGLKIVLHESVKVTDLINPNYALRISLKESVHVADVTRPDAASRVLLTEGVKIADAVSVMNTLAGQNVIAIPVDMRTGTAPVRVTYSNVTESGMTTLVISSSGPEAPAGFRLGTPPLYFELSSTALFTGPVTVCIDYSLIVFDTASIGLFHYENGAWVNVTSSTNTAGRIVCGTTRTLSPFAIFENAFDALGAELARSGLNAGEKNSLAVKLDAARKSFEQGRTIVAVNQLQAFINEVEALRASGRLAATDAGRLIAAAADLITRLQGGKK